MSTETQELDDLFNFTDELVSEFDNAEVKEPGKKDFTEVPNGEYVVKVERTEVKITPKGNKQLSMMLRVMEGEHAKRVFWKNGNLDKQGLTYVKTDLAILGFKSVRLTDLKSVVAELNDPANPKFVRVNKVAQKSNPQYSNVYFNEVVDKDELGEEPSVDNSDVSF